MVALHNKYGPVIRVGPNELSFNTTAAFHNMYAIDSSRRQLAEDEKLYGAETIGIRDSVVGSLSDSNHARQRKLLAHAFSDRALMEQEDMIVWHIDYFLKRLKEERVNDVASRLDSGSIDMKHWFSYLTFDLIGDMLLAEPFGCLKNNRLHPLIDAIFNTVKGLAFLSVMDHFSVLRAIQDYLLPTLLSNSIRKYFDYISEKADDRIAMGANRKDIMGYILKNGLSDENGVLQENDKLMTRHEMRANAFAQVKPICFYLGIRYPKTLSNTNRSIA